VTRTPLVLLALAFALVAPATASAAWLPIEDLGDIEFTDSEHVLAANDRGDAVAVWKDGRGIQVAVSRRGAAFGPARRVPGTSSGLLAGVGVLLSEDGRALIHWRRYDPSAFTQRAYVAGLKVDGGFGTTRSVTPAANYLAFEPAIGPGGRFAFTYATHTVNGQFKPMYARSAPPSGRLGPRRTIASGAISVRDVYYLGERPYVAYTRNADGHSHLFERRVDPLGRSRSVANLPRNGSLDLDTASNGTQAAVWSAGNLGESTKRPLFAAVRRAGGLFHGQEIDNRLPPQDIDVAVARSGAALVAYREFNESTTEDTPPPPGQTEPGRIVTSYKPARGSFRATRAFRPVAEAPNVGGLNADIDSDGLAVLGFGVVRYAGVEGRPYVALIDRGGDPDLTPIGENDGKSFGVLVAIDERDRTVASWRDEDSVFAMRGDFAR
jgi:hypothetical protein